MKTGVVDVGGGMRDVYAAGIFDYCLDENIQFDLYRSNKSTPQRVPAPKTAGQSRSPGCE